MNNRVIAASSLLALMVALVAPLAGAQQAPDRTVDRIDVNSATAEKLTELPRIGPAIAARIVEYRTENGPFKKIEELMNVRGIGVKVFEQLREHVVVKQAEAPPSKKPPAGN